MARRPATATLGLCRPRAACLTTAAIAPDKVACRDKAAMKLSDQSFHARVCHSAGTLVSLTGRHLGDRVSYGPGTALANSLDSAKDKKVTESTCVLLFHEQTHSPC